jgi:hypothetical protein
MSIRVSAQFSAMKSTIAAMRDLLNFWDAILPHRVAHSTRHFGGGGDYRTIIETAKAAF